MTRRKAIPPTYDPDKAVDGVLHTIAASVRRVGKQWYVTYRCPECDRNHRHGGGTGDRPTGLGQTWGSHCTYAPSWAPLVRLLAPEDTDEPA